MRRLSRAFILLMWGLLPLSLLIGCTPLPSGELPAATGAPTPADARPTAHPTVPPRDTPTLAPSPTFTSTPEPTPESTATPDPQAAGAGSVVVAFAHDGEVRVWREATGQTATIFDEGGARSVAISEDGRLIAFERNWTDEQGCLQMALWVVGIAGDNPRELIGPAELRRQYGYGPIWEPPACQHTFLSAYQMEWLPGGHQLLYSLYPDDSHAPPQGVYRIDAETGVVTALVQAEESLRFAPSPDGSQIALMSTTVLDFINTDGSDRRRDVATYLNASVTFPVFPHGAWTQDGQRFLLVAASENDEFLVYDYTIWRVSADGSEVQPLASIPDTLGESVNFSPDGTRTAFMRGVSVDWDDWAILPLSQSVGPVAYPYGRAFYQAGLHWSPGGQGIVILGSEPQTLLSLCPDAAEDSDVCGDPIELGGRYSFLRWVDSDRFVFLTNEPFQLALGRLDGAITAILTSTAEVYGDHDSYAVTLASPP